jgi:hypothetical protein
VTRSEKETGVTQNVQLHYTGQPNPLGAIVMKVMKVGMKHDVRTIVIGSKLVLIGQGVFSRRTLENRPFPLKASIAYTTFPCANALACDRGCSVIW